MKVSDLSFKIGCKSCMQTDGETYIIQIPSDPQVSTNFWEGSKLKSEHAINKNIRAFLNTSGRRCEFCSSSNLELYDIKFDGKSVLISPKVMQMHVIISKQGDQIRGDIDGHQYLPRGFSKRAYAMIEEELDRTSDKLFEEKKIGNTRFIVSAAYIGDSLEYTTRLEHFQFAGISKETIKKIVKALKEE